MIELEHIFVSYTKEFNTLQDISFTLGDGDKLVIVGEKEFALDIHQGIAKSFVVGSCESDVFVIILGFIIRRIEIEDGVRTVILLDELFEILVFDHHGL